MWRWIKRLWSDKGGCITQSTAPRTLSPVEPEDSSRNAAPADGELWATAIEQSGRVRLQYAKQDIRGWCIHPLQLVASFLCFTVLASGLKAPNSFCIKSTSASGHRLPIIYAPQLILSHNVTNHDVAPSAYCSALSACMQRPIPRYHSSSETSTAILFRTRHAAVT